MTIVIIDATASLSEREFHTCQCLVGLPMIFTVYDGSDFDPAGKSRSS